MSFNPLTAGFGRYRMIFGFSEFILDFPSNLHKDKGTFYSINIDVVLL